MKEKKDLIRYAILCIVVLFLVIHYWDLAMAWIGTFLRATQPLLAGCIIAYILNLIMSFYERNLLKSPKMRFTLKRSASICLSIVTLVLILSLIVNMVLPELRSCIDVLLSSIPAAYNLVVDFLDQYPELTEQFPELFSTQINIQNVRNILEQFFSWLSSGVGASVFGYISSFFSVIINSFVSLIFAIYFLACKEWLGRQFNRLLDTYIQMPVIKKRFFYVMDTLNNSFHRFIVGQCTEAVILGTLCIIGMMIFRFPYAVMIGVLIGATALIPIFGAYIGGAVGFIMIVTVSPIKALFFVLFLMVLQQLEGQLIYPRVVGSSIGLPGILVFSAVTVGASLFGIAGVLLGIPLMAAAYQILKDDLRAREKPVKKEEA